MINRIDKLQEKIGLANFIKKTGAIMWPDISSCAAYFESFHINQEMLVYCQTKALQRCITGMFRSYLHLSLWVSPHHNMCRIVLLYMHVQSNSQMPLGKCPLTYFLSWNRFFMSWVFFISPHFYTCISGKNVNIFNVSYIFIFKSLISLNLICSHITVFLLYKCCYWLSYEFGV